MDDFDERRQEYYDRKVRKADETFFLFARVCGIALLVGIVVSLFV